jgi:hypothetical protein
MEQGEVVEWGWAREGAALTHAQATHRVFHIRGGLKPRFIGRIYVCELISDSCACGFVLQ